MLIMAEKHLVIASDVAEKYYNIKGLIISQEKKSLSDSQVMDIILNSFEGDKKWMKKI